MAMLNVPNRPTDNLYRFAALAGLVTWLAAAFGPVFLALRLQTAVDALRIELSETDATAASHMKAAELIDEESAALKSLNDAAKGGLDEMDRRSRELEARIEQALTSGEAAEIRDLVDETRGQTEELGRQGQALGAWAAELGERARQLTLGASNDSSLAFRARE